VQLDEGSSAEIATKKRGKPLSPWTYRGERMPDDRLLTEPLLDAREAAKLLHVPRSTLYELVRSRGLPHVRIGQRGVRFTRTDLERWVDENSARR
jgi:excisionase family DNA binding protein